MVLNVIGFKNFLRSRGPGGRKRDKRKREEGKGKRGRETRRKKQEEGGRGVEEKTENKNRKRQ